MKFPSIDKYVRKDEKIITSNEHSKNYVNIPELMSKYAGGLFSTLRMRLPILHKMIACMIESKKSASSIVKNPHLGKDIISKNDLEKLEQYIKSLGVDLIGYTKVDRDMIFKGHNILYDNAIVLVMRMKKEKISQSPSNESLKEVFRTYHELGSIVNKVANFLRRNGYNAMAGPAIGGDVNYVSLAEKAGLGAIGKHGLLITDKDFGPSLRIASVYTDIKNLSIKNDNPHKWIYDFCDKCNACVNNCPAGAIYKEKTALGTCIDNAKCAVPFANNYGCTVCIKSCTFFKHESAYLYNGK